MCVRGKGDDWAVTSKTDCIPLLVAILEVCEATAVIFQQATVPLRLYRVLQVLTQTRNMLWTVVAPECL